MSRGWRSTQAIDGAEALTTLKAMQAGGKKVTSELAWLAKSCDELQAIEAADIAIARRIVSNMTIALQRS